MRERHPIKKFTPEQMDLLAANPFTLPYLHTLEFKNLFLARYETGEGAREIFQSLGYDTELLGDGRIYSFAYRLSRQADAGELLSEAHPATKRDKPPCVDYNTMPAQQSVAAMQCEIPAHP